MLEKSATSPREQLSRRTYETHTFCTGLFQKQEICLMGGGWGQVLRRGREERGKLQKEKPWN